MPRRHIALSFCILLVACVVLYHHAELWLITSTLINVSSSWIWAFGPSINDPGAEPNVLGREPFYRHIIAVGDLHGDMANARKVLQFSGVVDEFGNWTGNADFFVQTGDIIDRGDDTIALFTWMDKLRGQAAGTGGTVLSLLGNHEWMNAIASLLAKRCYQQAALAAPGRGTTPPLHDYLYTLLSAHLISHTLLHPSLPLPTSKNQTILAAELRQKQDPLTHAAISFVHGGLSPSYSNLSPFPTRINEIGSSLLRKLQDRVQPPPHPPNPYPGLPASATAEEHEMYGVNGPVWYRGWAENSEEQVCKEVDAVLDKTGTRRMIMGHTPNFRNIVSRCDGKIIIIDTGISHAYGGVLSALSIDYSLIPVMGQDGKEQWEEREVVTTLYADWQEVIVDDVRLVEGHFQHWV